MFYPSIIYYNTEVGYSASKAGIQYPRWLTCDPQPDPPGKLALDDKPRRIYHLNRDRSNLLDRVVQITATRSHLIATIDRIDRLIKTSTADLNHQGAELDRSIHKLFTAALNRPKLGVKTRVAIEDIYRSLQGTIVSFNLSEPDRIPQAQEQAQHYHWTPPIQPESTEIDPELKQKIRVVYLRLASLYHPDKHPGSVYHAQLMQEINAAYDRGDLAQLLEIERGDARNLSAAVDPTAELLDQIQYLKRQIDSQLSENRQLKNSPTYQIWELIENDRDPIGNLIQRLAAQVELMRSLSKILTDFCNKKIGVKDLLIKLNTQKP